MGINSKNKCQECIHYQEDEPCTGTGLAVAPYQLVGDCTLFEPVKNHDNNLIPINKIVLQSGDKLTIPLPVEVCNQLKLNKGDRIGGIFDKNTGILIFQKGEITL